MDLLNNLFISKVDEIISALIKVVVMYAILMLYIRVFGKRTASQMSNFDWIITVAMGAIFSSTIILDDITIANGAISIFALILLQYVLTKIMTHWNFIENMVQSPPTLLIYKGEFMEENMHKERVTRQEVYAALRAQGFKQKEQVYAVVLESNAQFSVLATGEEDQIGMTLEGVKGLPDDLQQEFEEGT